VVLATRTRLHKLAVVMDAAVMMMQIFDKFVRGSDASRIFLAFSQCRLNIGHRRPHNS